MNTKAEEVFDPNAAAAASEKTDKKNGSNPDKKTGSAADKKTDSAADKKSEAEPKAPAVLTIESDIPLPESNAGRKTAFNAARMPFSQLEVGQSFAEVLSDGKTADGITVKTVMAQVKKAFPDRTFVVREIETNGVTSARFWRKK